MGVSNLRLVGMVLLQAMLVGLIGFGLGVGLAAIFGSRCRPQPAGVLHALACWSALAAVLSSSRSGLLSIRKVLVLEPAMVWVRG